MRRTSTWPRREREARPRARLEESHRVVAEEAEAVRRERGAGRARTRARRRRAPTPRSARAARAARRCRRGSPRRPPSMPARAAASSVAASVSPSGRQPPRGGEMPAHVTVFTSGGRDIDHGSRLVVVADLGARPHDALDERAHRHDRVELLVVGEREGAQAEHGGALVEDAARIEDRGVHGEDAGARDEPHRPVFDAPGALQVGVQVAERQAVGERELLNHLLSKLPRERRRPGGSRAAVTRGTAHRHGGTMNGPIDGLLSTLHLTDTGARTTRGHLHRAVAVDAARACLRRAGARAVARRRDAHRAGRPHHPLDARLLPAARRRGSTRSRSRSTASTTAARSRPGARRRTSTASRSSRSSRRSRRTTRASSTRSTCRPTCPTPRSLPSTADVLGAHRPRRRPVLVERARLRRAAHPLARLPHASTASACHGRPCG